MLKISQAQYDAFSSEEVVKFTNRLTNWLIRNHVRGGNPPAKDELCRRSAEEAYNLCSKHGVTLETDIALIALRILRWGPKLAAPDVVHVLPILQDQTIPPEDKIDAILLRDAMREAGEMV